MQDSGTRSTPSVADEPLGSAQEVHFTKALAEAATRSQDEFLANVSHEILTPMNAILGMTELVLDSDLGEEQRQSLRTVKAAATTLLEILNNVLDYSNIEAGHVALDLGELGLRATLGATLRALAARAHRKGLELISNVASDVPDALVGDVDRLRQVLLNLVGNAIKFTPTGEVVVHVSVLQHDVSSLRVELRFEVRDTGIGIAVAKQRSIFGAFEQADNSTTRRYGGTGLGLTIAARLVELMGGRIDVQSAPDLGSTFAFTAWFTTRAESQPPVSGAEIRLRDMRVLVVDDNAVNRRILEEWLRTWQLRPSVAGDALAALDALWHGVSSSDPFALVLLDARMPDTDGLTLAAKIRERTELAGTRIVLLTSGERPGDLERLRALRIEAHLLKPVPQEELLDTIYAVMSRDEHRREAREPVALSPRHHPWRILVAEDNELNASLVRQLLAKEGHEVVLASTGRAALELATSGDFDLLLLDLHMPELDGFGVVRALRSHEATGARRLPVIALTARARAEDHERCLAAGMDDVLVKPLRVKALWAAMDRVSPETRSEAISGVLDAPVLLAACGEDRGILAALCRGLVARLAGDIAHLRVLLAVGDPAPLREAAHTVCGMVAACSSVTAAVASELEDCAARGDLLRAAELVVRLESLGAALVTALSTITLDDLRRAAAQVG